MPKDDMLRWHAGATKGKLGTADLPGPIRSGAGKVYSQNFALRRLSEVRHVKDRLSNSKNHSFE